MPYHMQSNDYMVESDKKETLEWYRSDLHRGLFKGARIKHVVQFRPDLIKINRIYKISNGQQIWP